MTRKLISSGSPFEATIAYSRAVVQDGWVFVSGTTGYDYDTMTMPEDVAQQCDNTLNTIKKALQDAGGTMADVVRVRYILPNADEFAACYDVLQKHFGDIRPAATMIEARLLDPAMKIEIEVTARLQTP
ncbi:MAG: RidA family protein [Maritimibacter sp.]